MCGMRQLKINNPSKAGFSGRDSAGHTCTDMCIYFIKGVCLSWVSLVMLCF